MSDSTRPELTWSGKYDDQSNLRPVERTILPFQVVETVNESKADREAGQRDFFTKQAKDRSWRNRLIWGDNKIVMSSLLPELAGKIATIYIDPPFATGQDFSFPVQIGGEELVKEPSFIEEKAYRDTWGAGLGSYLSMMHDRLRLMYELLAPDGALFVHMDYHVGDYIKVLLDEIFGQEGFRNEIVWWYWNKFEGNINHFPRNHDVIYYYAKSDNPKFLHQFEERDKPVKQLRRKWDKDKGKIVNVRGEDGKVEYIDSTQRRVDDVWRIPMLQPADKTENVGYPTQKRMTIAERIVAATTDKGDIVADFFCGSGTTLVAAEALERRWIGSDLSKWSIQVTRKRLLQTPSCRSFELQNLGNYERHKLASNGHGAWERYVRFILDLYRAEAVEGFKNLHGRKARAYVHVGSMDSPITMREIRAALEEARKSGMKEVHFLGWDFEMGIHDLGTEIQEEYGVKPRLVSIPKEALEVSNPAKEEVRFFDLNYLELQQELKGSKLTVALKDFIIANPEYLPDEVRAKIKKFTDYIDYWAVDWDYRDDTFHNQWQSFRTRKEPKLDPRASFTYEKAGKYKVLVKVVDVFGNDTTKLLEVAVK